MTHEPECESAFTQPAECICFWLRRAYTRGFNDHARAAQHWQDTHGAYRAADDSVRVPLERYAEMRRREENP